ncbi:MAG: hypothetical protein HRU19_14770 [Pseudobacteriovorax sp.]|nr:hypothetical protein [Pseudobacteriovorax sp.]
MKIASYDIGIFILSITICLFSSYFNISSTTLGYKIGETKQTEIDLIERRSLLESELAKITSKSSLKQLSIPTEGPKDGKILASY